jgi:hypothetical protein
VWLSTDTETDLAKRQDVLDIDKGYDEKEELIR